MAFYSGFGEKIILPNGGTNQSDGCKQAPWDTVIHRGWISGAKENTLPAFFLAREKGFRWVECDVRFSSDGVPVLAHDATITSEDGKTTLSVVDSTVAQLQNVVLETSEAYGQIRLSTLEELLNMARLIDLSVLIDLKSSGDMARLARVVLASGWSRRVVYMPGTVDQAASIAAIDHNASFDFVTYASSVPSDYTVYAALLNGNNTVGFDISATSAEGNVTRNQLDSIRMAGLTVSWWNVRESNCAFVFDSCPLRVTKANAADSVDLDALYLTDKTFW